MKKMIMALTILIGMQTAFAAEQNQSWWQRLWGWVWQNPKKTLALGAAAAGAYCLLRDSWTLSQRFAELDKNPEKRKTAVTELARKIKAYNEKFLDVNFAQKALFVLDADNYKGFHEIFFESVILGMNNICQEDRYLIKRYTPEIQDRLIELYKSDTRYNKKREWTDLDRERLLNELTTDLTPDKPQNLTSDKIQNLASDKTQLLFPTK